MKVAISVLLVITLSGCAQMMLQQETAITNKFASCMNSTPIGRKASCAYVYSNDLMMLSDSDSRKPALLKMSRQIYQIYFKVDRGQLSEQEGKSLSMRAVNNAYAEMQAADRRSSGGLSAINEGFAKAAAYAAPPPSFYQPPLTPEQTRTAPIQQSTPWAYPSQTLGTCTKDISTGTTVVTCYK